MFIADFMRNDFQKQNKGEIIIYQSKGGEVSLDVKLDKETVWLAQSQIALLFNTERSVITKHLRNVFDSKELNKNSVCAKIAHTATKKSNVQLLHIANFDKSVPFWNSLPRMEKFVDCADISIIEII
jgi:hypothetical protein